jgi:predicted nucleic acid-binding protein
VASFFLDSSAVVKRYVAEVGTGWVRVFMARAAGHDLFLARITGVEVVSALVRRIPALPPSQLVRTVRVFQHDLGNHFRLVATNQRLLNQAMLLATRHRLRGYDAVQLAAAVESRRRIIALGLASLTFVSADSNLNAAATAEGFAVDNPNHHP